jgi:hypothetical protein
MISDLRASPDRLGDAVHQLFMGRDTDEAEAAAHLIGQWLNAQFK